MKKTTFNRSPLETNLINKLEKYLKTTYKQEAWFFKTSGNAAQKSGIPDIHMCIRGYPIYIETKREDGSGVASEQQKIECKNICKAGGYALISDDLKEIKNFIESIVNK